MSGPDVFLRHVTASSHLPPHCDPVDSSLQKFSSYWNTCVPTYLALLSTILGSCSIVAWLFAQLPQIYKNYKIQSTAGLSAYFLVVWCLGDTSNLVGALLTGQATWQVIVASYYTFVDCVLVWQFFWYELMGKGRKRRAVLVGKRRAAGPDGSNERTGEREPLLAPHVPNGVNGDAGSSKNGNSNEQSDGGPDSFKFPALVNNISPEEKDTPESSSPGRNSVRVTRPTGSASSSPGAIVLFACLCIALGRASPISPQSFPSASISGSPPVSASSQEDTKELAGRIISWASTILYLVSRFPQLIKNYRRKSTSGLSPSLFAAAFCGNLFYSSSLLTNPLAWDSYGPYGHRGWAGPEGSTQSEWVLSATPFFLGAAGVLALDAAVGVQFLAYGDGRRKGAADKYTPRVPVVVETPPTRNATGLDAGAGSGTRTPRSRVLAVPPGGPHESGRLLRPGVGAGSDFESGSWRRVSGYMRGWVPSFSPGSWSRNGYMASAASAGRAARDRIASGFATPRSRSSGSSGSGSGSGGIRAEAEAWESRHGTRSGSVAGDDDDRPLLEQGQDRDRYGGT